QGGSEPNERLHARALHAALYLSDGRVAHFGELAEVFHCDALCPARVAYARPDDLGSGRMESGHRDKLLRRENQSPEIEGPEINGTGRKVRIVALWYRFAVTHHPLRVHANTLRLIARPSTKDTRTS